MKVDKAEEIINNMYQKRMSQMEEETNEGLIIHLGTKVEFTKEEEASVILLRELQNLRRKLTDSIPKSKVKEKIEELREKEELLSDEQGYWGGSDLLAQIDILQELLGDDE